MIYSKHFTHDLAYSKHLISISCIYGLETNTGRPLCTEVGMQGMNLTEDMIIKNQTGQFCFRPVVSKLGPKGQVGSTSRFHIIYEQGCILIFKWLKKNPKNNISEHMKNKCLSNKLKTKFKNIKLFLKKVCTIATFIHLSIVPDCFQATMAEPSSCDRDYLCGKD